MSSRSHDSVSSSPMLVWHTLVATPVSNPAFRQWSRPRRVRLSTSLLPRRSSLVISRPSMEISGVALPSSLRRWATFSVMNWPLVNTWK